MARSMWKGSLAFGLVNIPIELYSATRDHRPKFRLLHAKDEAPVRYERVCQTEGKPVAWEDLVKGYEYEKGHFVVLTKDDFKTAALEKTKTIDILDFVDPTADRRAVLRDAVLSAAGERVRSDRMRCCARRFESPDKLGVAKIILRDAQHLAAVEAIGDALVSDDDAIRRRTGGSRRFHVSESGRHPAGRTEDGDAAHRQSQRRVGAREIHRRIPRQSDEGHSGQAEGTPAAPPGARDGSVGRRRRSDGAAAGEPRRQGGEAAAKRPLRRRRPAERLGASRKHAAYAA